MPAKAMNDENSAPTTKKMSARADDVVSAGSRESRTRSEHAEHGEGLELPAEERGGALLDTGRDLLHPLGARVVGQDPARQEAGDDQREHRDDGDADHDRAVLAGQCEPTSGRDAGHAFSLG